MASFAIDDRAVRATCPACRHVMSVPEGPPASPAAAAATATDIAGPGGATAAPPDAPGDAALCPKCGAVGSGDAIACGSCGLAVARMAAYTDARDAAVPDPVRQAWTRATAAWSDDALHDELLRLVATHNAYAWAAGRYRTRGDDAVARRQLDRLRRAAEATLLASATIRPGAEIKPYRGTAGVLAVLVVVIVIGLFYAVVIRDHPSSRSRGPSGPGTPGSSGAVRPLVPGQPVSPSTIK